MRIKTLFLLLSVTLLTSTPVFADRFDFEGERRSTASTQQETVMFNTKSHKFHKPSCHHAARCTRNCVSIDKNEALKRGGVACKTCGG